jgi:rubredoxin
MSLHWLDNADSWICPVCGFETGSPAKYEGCKCPKCGFQDDKDRVESEEDENK